MTYFKCLSLAIAFLSLNIICFSQNTLSLNEILRFTSKSEFPINAPVGLWLQP